MENPRWSEQLSRIVPQDADDLDAVLGEFDPRHGASGRDVFPQIEAVLRPTAAMKRPDAVCVGVRMPTVMADSADRAMRLAAFAAEQDVEIVVLAETDGAGLERFGFRSERIAGEVPEAREVCIGQIRRFWNIDLLL